MSGLPTNCNSQKIMLVFFVNIPQYYRVKNNVNISKVISNEQNYTPFLTLAHVCKIIYFCIGQNLCISPTNHKVKSLTAHGHTEQPLLTWLSANLTVHCYHDEQSAIDICNIGAHFEFEFETDFLLFK